MTVLTSTTKAALFAALVFLSACGTYQKTFYQIQGATMGTFYHITYEGTQPAEMQEKVDSLLILINNSLSTYIPTSTISKINSNESMQVDDYFVEVFTEAKKVYAETDGAFDPTVGPLVNAWGFGFKNGTSVDSATIDSLMQFVGFDKVTLQNGQIAKAKKEIILDFSAIAKGFGVDKVAQLLVQEGVENFMVEIGGEVVTRGVNHNKRAWVIGINKPEEGTDEIFAAAEVDGKGLATSGNYRNFRMVNGERYVHTINPKTGYGAMSKLLSASVMADNCMRADAFATAFMAMGTQKAIETAEKINDIGIYLIFLDDENKYDTYKKKGYEEIFKVGI